MRSIVVFTLLCIGLSSATKIDITKFFSGLSPILTKIINDDAATSNALGVLTDPNTSVLVNNIIPQFSIIINSLQQIGSELQDVLNLLKKSANEVSMGNIVYDVPTELLNHIKTDVTELSNLFTQVQSWNLVQTFNDLLSGNTTKNSADSIIAVYTKIEDTFKSISSNSKSLAHSLRELDHKINISGVGASNTIFMEQIAQILSNCARGYDQLGNIMEHIIDLDKYQLKKEETAQERLVQLLVIFSVNSGDLANTFNALAADLQNLQMDIEFSLLRSV